MFTKQSKIMLVRHGIPRYGGDSELHPDFVSYLDRTGDRIADRLEEQAIGRVVLLSSLTKRTRQTAEHVGRYLATDFDVSEVVEVEQLGLDTPLGEVRTMLWKPACAQLSVAIDELADERSVVVAFTHEPVIFAIAHVMGVEPDIGYGGVTDIH